jgi:mRNA interferase RelE/StbE
VNLLFKESFARDLGKIPDEETLARIRQVIDTTEKARTLREIPHIKKLRTAGDFFRIRVGQYRIGLLAEKDQITFVRCLHRRDIYRFLPHIR